MRRRRKRTKSKVGILFVALILLLSSLVAIGGSYGFWYDTLTVEGDITTNNWDACIKIRKNLVEGCEGYKCGDKFTLTIEVMNNGSGGNDLTGVKVTDTIGNKATLYGDADPSKGYVEWYGKDFEWFIGDLAVDETVTLSMCLEVNVYCSCNEYISAEVQTPLPGYIEVPRVTQPGNIPGVGRYNVIHEDSGRAIKYENLDPQLGEGGKVQTDTFDITVLDGSTYVLVQTKAGKPYHTNILEGVGDSIVDDGGFTITLVSITDLGGGVNKYQITITSDGKECTPDLSHVYFHFGKKCEIHINDGAKVTAKSIWCDLVATTDEINLYIYKFYIKKPCAKWFTVEGPSLPIVTPWAWDCADLCCNC